MRLARALLFLAFAAASLHPVALADDWAITREKASEPRVVRHGTLEDRLLARLIAQPDDDLTLEQLLDVARARQHDTRSLEQRLREQSQEPRGFAELALARVLASAQRWDEAVALLDGALARGVRPAVTLRLRARLHAQRGRRQEARADYVAVLALEPKAGADDRAVALRGLMELAVDEGDVEQARSRFEELARSDRRTRDDELARLLRARGREVNAADEYARLLERARTPAERARIGAELARSELALGRAERALATLDRLRSHGAAAFDPELHKLEVQAHRRRGTLREYAELLANEAPRNRPELLREAAELYRELGDEERARACLEALLVRQPSDMGARRELAAAQVRAGDLASAERTYRELRRRDPSDSSALSALAELMFKAGRREEALALVRSALRAKPGNVALLVATRELYRRFGEEALAAEALDTLAQLEPEREEHVIALAERALLRGDKAGALSLFQRLRRGVADAAQAEARLALVLGDHDLITEAVGHAERAYALTQRAPEQRLLAGLLERAGRDADAELAFRALRTRADADAATRREARERLSVLFRRMGVLAQRTSELELELRRDPNQTETMRFLAELYARDPSKAAQRVALLEQLRAVDPADREVLRELERAELAAGNASSALRIARARLEAGERSEADVLAALDLARAHASDPQAALMIESARAHSPQVATIERRIAELLSAQNDREGARAAFGRAVALDPRDFQARLALAEIELNQGRADAAREQLLAVVSEADEDEIVRAALELYLDTSAEPTRSAPLLELVRRYPQRVSVRRYWLERGALELLPLARRVRAGVADPRERAALERSMAEGRLALLEALSSDRASERERALLLFEVVAEPLALERLLALSESPQRGREERARALLAIGKLRDPRATSRLRALRTRETRHLRPLATWALAQSGGATVLQDLRAALADRDGASVAVAALALATLRDRAALPGLERLTGDVRPAVRAAAIWGVASLEPTKTPRMVASAPPLGTVLLALHAAEPAVVADALIAVDGELRADAAALLAPRAVPVVPPPYPVAIDAYVRAFAIAHAPPLAALAAEQVAKAVSARIATGDAAGALASLVATGGGIAPAAALEAGTCSGSEFARALAEHLRPELRQLASVEDRAVRDRALTLLLLGGSPDDAAIQAALDRGDASSTGALLDAAAGLAREGELPPALRASIERKRGARAWPLRMRVARVLSSPKGEPTEEPVALVRTPPPSSSRLVRCVPSRPTQTSN